MKREPVEYLTLLPCACYVLAVHYTPSQVVGICKRCRKASTHSRQEWEEMKVEGTALDKPIRV